MTQRIDLAVVPVAGLGTRLLPDTKSQPKEMLCLARKPVVQYVVEELGRSGIRRVLFITSRGKSSIEQHFDIDEQLTQYLRETGREEQLMELAFERWELQYFYTRQRRQLGLGHAVLCAAPLVGDQPFAVALGDSIIGRHGNSTIVRQMIRLLQQEKADVVIALEEVEPEEVVHYGIAATRESSGAVRTLRDVVEKPAVEEAPSRLAVAARYVFRPSIFDALRNTTPGKGGEIQLTDAIRLLLAQGARGLGVVLPPDQRRYDIGNFDSYFRAFVEFALDDPQHGPALRRHVRALLADSPQAENPPCS